MQLFSDLIDENINLLPNDGVVNYFGKLFSLKQANEYFDLLMNGIEWKNDEAVMFGKHIITKRKVAWFADKEYAYTYSNITKQACKWTDTLLELKKIVEEKTNSSYNSCLLNLYHSGNEGMAWHSDDEKTLGKNSAIASLTFGAERKFSFKHKQPKETVSVILEHGSMLVMKDTTQTNWLHRLPPTTKIKDARINLTFRTMIVE